MHEQNIGPQLRSPPGLAKQTSTPAATAARSRRSAPDGARAAGGGGGGAVAIGGAADCSVRLLEAGVLILSLQQLDRQGSGAVASKTSFSTGSRPPAAAISNCARLIGVCVRPEGFSSRSQVSSMQHA